MNTIYQIKTLLLKEIELAARQGDFRTIKSLSRLASSIPDESLGVDEARTIKSSIRPEVDETPVQRQQEAIRSAETPSKRKRSLMGGDLARVQFLGILENDGIKSHLRNGKRSLVTETGKRFSIAYATENPKNRGNYFFGVKEEPVDVVVFLCAASGVIHPLIVPKPVLASVWNALALRDGERKMNVRRRDGRWLLRVPSIDVELPLDGFMDDHTPLKG